MADAAIARTKPNVHGTLGDGKTVDKIRSVLQEVVSWAIVAKTVPMSRRDERTQASSARDDTHVRLDVPVSPGGIVAGKYRIDAIIGFRGMAIVCEGFHLDLESKVEIQIAHSEHVNDEAAGARFLSEARSAAQLRSQHTRRILDCGRLDVGTPYRIVEHLDGTDLRSVGTARGRLRVEETTRFVLQACEALAEAHSWGLVHGDLKPESLVLTRGPDGGDLIKVLDLGVSKPLGTLPRSATLTEAAEDIGMSHYVSPEQRLDPTAVDVRTDVWSLGILLYELLTGKLPSDGSPLTRLSANTATPDPVLSGNVDAAIPEGLAAIVLQCMDRNPDARFPDAAALGRALRAASPSAASVVRSVPAAAHSVPAGRPSRGAGPPPLPPSHSLPSPTPKRFLGRHRGVFAVVGVLIGGFVGLLASHRAHPDSAPSGDPISSARAPTFAPSNPTVLPAVAPAVSLAPPAAAPASAELAPSQPTRSVAPPHEPVPSTTPLPARPPRPARAHAWSLYPELKPPELPPNIH